VTGYELRVAGYELRVTSCGLVAHRDQSIAQSVETEIGIGKSECKRRKWQRVESRCSAGGGSAPPLAGNKIQFNQKRNFVDSH
ncbi:MAG: hypothetical protein KJP23_27030, partial [Deltaproteobacteria bacterium]|nr:hypothetical protein [Deltaproteobacteria bacterium]